MWTPSERYPDPSVEVLDERFRGLILWHARVERLYEGTRWGEGPVWFGDQRCLLWSDIPNDRMLRWEEETGAVSVYRRGGHTNGNTRDRQGRLISCQHAARAVVRTEIDGTRTVLADSFEGKRLNAPNDVVVKSDGSVWFSDPTFGILSHYEGGVAEPELPTNVYRIDGETGEMTVVIEGIVQPNGLCFSPGEDRLYLVESGAQPRRIHVFDVTADGRGAENGRVFVDAGGNGTPDGFRCDVQGNLWAGWGLGEGLDGVRVFAPDGTAIGHIHLPERCANLCFGGPHRTRLFMAAAKSLYSLFVKVQGVGYA
ncbi:SMP-30/gluconolactonase/LRE family protein [Psychromarinibacter sp. C21-152]|uniref:SMP-30/gluconolactonase/LRE family protein n=1 Tax=Psychromarinibacter sediminicola TaxID=3033385 RepID=A0AAE3NVX0_9RHOB|nr:SMP-30/gluconolactonase/LRE family protein [Psychromarinibacter sediminicola]MDF0603086.1 SMP-30/gluconolactonase/LRE family protein [Psychromarinibacter sediminicola]